MGASDSRALLGRLHDVVECLGKHHAAPKKIVRPLIGTLHFLPMPEGERAVWGAVQRLGDGEGLRYVVFEVEGDDVPTIAQEAHYEAVLRLEPHYTVECRPALLSLLEQVPHLHAREPISRALGEFRILSVRIPPDIFHGGEWKLRFVHREIHDHTFEVDYRGINVLGGSLYSDPLTT